MSADSDLETITSSLRVVSLSPTKEAEFPYIYCDTQTQLDSLNDNIESLLKESTVEAKSPIYLDCEGRDLGRIGGELGLVQLGLENKIYLVDVIAYPKSLKTVKDILENPVLEKIVWDGRSDYAELWHGHGIAMHPVLDLQLVRIYQTCDGLPGYAGFIKLEGMSRVFDKLGYQVRQGSGVDVNKMTRVHEEIKAKHLRNETEFWIQRPLSRDLLDYASFDVMQLKVLHISLCREIAKRSHIAAESKRYVEMHRGHRCVAGGLYVDHGLLPQEILERSPLVVAKNEQFGTRACDGCERELHQDSFSVPFSSRRLYSPRLCHTCKERKRWSSSAGRRMW